MNRLQITPIYAQVKMNAVLDDDNEDDDDDIGDYYHYYENNCMPHGLFSEFGCLLHAYAVTMGTVLFTPRKVAAYNNTND